MITIGIPTIKCFDLLAQAIERYQQCIEVSRIVVIDNSCGECPPISGAEIFVQEKNLGVAASWNKLFDLCSEPLLIANDDVLVEPGAIPEMVHAFHVRPDVGLFYGNTAVDNMFSFFLLRHSAFRTVGRFDERFSPAYFEDCDYHYRMKLAGITDYKIESARYQHIGSATLKQKNEAEQAQHHISFVLNKGYYITKWGSEPGKERYKTPFNKG